ncbi:MAG: DeoR family transcriptional regulator, partial [Chloroflexota bacterium]|nr:DeoR family transcriptional regulator [Chloroflexota bacterium]
MSAGSKRNGDNGGLPTSLRRGRVAEAIRRSQYTSVSDLATTFGVSEVTIRSDLDALAQSGLVRRVRGGAVHRAAGSLEASFEHDANERAAEKAAIGEAAAALVESGQTVMLGVGSVVAAVARALALRTDLADVTVVT